MGEQNQSISSITFFEYRKGKRWWAFNQMQLAIGPLKKLDGILFFKLMGTGGGFGFSVKPDFRTYCLFIVWEDREAAKRYTQSDAYLHFNQNCKTNFTYWMGCVQSRGTWGGINPLTDNFSYTKGPLMILTRARINWSKILRFVKHTPQASRSLEGAEGLLFTKGIGEWPLIEQATFSYWENAEHMKNYAYQESHLDIIKKVKQEGWYKEELFARFIPIPMEKL